MSKMCKIRYLYDIIICWIKKWMLLMF